MLNGLRSVVEWDKLEELLQDKAHTFFRTSFIILKSRYSNRYLYHTYIYIWYSSGHPHPPVVFARNSTKCANKGKYGRQVA